MYREAAYQDCRFPVSNRILKASDFTYILSHGNVIPAQGYRLILLGNTLHHARLGLAISSRHLPHAVDRNRIKRMVREMFRTHPCRLTPFDIIFASGRKIAELSSTMLVANIVQVFDSLVEDGDPT
jgi:ribonuclease P protein component